MYNEYTETFDAMYDAGTVVNGLINKSTNWLNSSGESQSLVCSLIPGISDAKDVQELIVPYDMAAGRWLTNDERLFTVLAVAVPFVGRKVISEGANYAVRHTDEIIDIFEGAGQSVWKNADLMDELASSGVKYSPDDVLGVTKTADGKLVWLENGNSNAGMQHILDHVDDFANKGIQQNQIQDLVMESLTNGKVVGYQGKGTGRPIYEVVFNGQTHHTAITVGNNGFVVGANPTTWQ
jgi:hypothetical protein